MHSILFVSYYFPPRGGSGVQRAAKFARYLPGHGYRPIVLTCDDGSITQTRDASLLGELAGTEVVRVPGREDVVKRLARWHLGPLTSLTLQPDAQILWRDAAVTAGVDAAERHDAAAIYTTVQPFSAALVGLDLKRRLGLPWVLDYRDPWTNSQSLVWPSRWHYERERAMERTCLAEADRVVVVTPGMRDRLAEAFPRAASKIRLIPNGYDPTDLEDLPRAPAQDGIFRIAFTGRLYPLSGKRNRRHRARFPAYRHSAVDFTTHSAGPLFRAVRRLLAQHPELRPHLRIDLAGNIPADHAEYIAGHGLSDVVTLHGMLPHREALTLVARANAVFLPMRTELDGQRSYNASGKIYEYLGQGKPILAAVPEGDAADIVRQAMAGWVVDPYDEVGFTQTLVEQIRRHREGRPAAVMDRAFISGYTRQRQTALLASEFDALLGLDVSTPRLSPQLIRVS